MNRPVATVSVDVDPVDLHLLGYGYRGLPPDPLAYTAALPRLLDLFARTGITATLFVVGRDAETHAAVIAAIAREGHEVASHTMSHPFAFASLPAAERRRELLESRHALERAAGTPVTGFRSPNFDLDAASIGELTETGYRYDASGYPTPLLLPARLLLAWKSRDAAAVLRLRSWPFTWRRDPFVWSAGGHSIQEFPVAVTPGIRFPVYHTARYLMDDARFERILDGFVARGESLSYPLHAADALGLAEDRVDPRFAPHPGMERPLAAKLELLEKSLGAIARRFESAPFAARLGQAAEARRQAS